MAKAFIGKVTTTGGAADRLSALLAAEGYDGSMMGKFLLLGGSPLAVSVFYGSSDAADATTGVEIIAGDTHSFPAHRGIIDPALIWIFTAATQEVPIAFFSI